MTRWWRRTLRNRGIYRPFPALICPRYVKSIHVRAGAGVDVNVERTLVYLQAPDAAELWDLVPLAEGECEIHASPDSEELLRVNTPKGTRVHWRPREAIVPYGLYVHTHGWTAPGSPDEAALYTELRCETRTGVAVLELSTTGTFDAAVAFPWPAWRRLWSVQALVRYALEQIEASQGQQPEVLDDGSRLRWTLVNPRVGDRYACVAFPPDGIAMWQNRLAASTLPARMRRLLRSVSSF